ncbi:MAG: molybdenum cofactor guanylyltransferase [Gemmatimonadetes bacterium]|nr:molybdenum cofactor guanylyltransferase [Gemmatimonadota bacterium]
MPQFGVGRGPARRCHARDRFRFIQMKQSLFGAVLVGGRSSRMGRPKWREQVGGIPMAVRAAAALEPHAREIATVAPDDRPRLPGTSVLLDAMPGRGPLSALVAVLERARQRGDAGALVLACDLPLVDAALIGTLVDAWAGEDVVAPTWRGQLQPLCALWSVSALLAAREALAAERLSVLDLVSQLRIRNLTEVEWKSPDGASEPLINVNSPADLARVRSLLAHGRRVG